MRKKPEQHCGARLLGAEHSYTASGSRQSLSVGSAQQHDLTIPKLKRSIAKGDDTWQALSGQTSCFFILVTIEISAFSY